jgi:hypothetical protein
LSGRFAVVISEQAAEAAVAENGAVACGRVGWMLWEEQAVVFTLMRAFFVIMGEVFGDGVFGDILRGHHGSVENADRHA